MQITQNNSPFYLHPFGMLMPGRTFSSEAYSWGFNGKEKDDEISGEGNTVVYEMRVYNPRLGKFFSIDPSEKNYPWQGPYCYYSNCPTKIIDFLGLGDEETESKADKPIGTIYITSSSRQYSAGTNAGKLVPDFGSMETEKLELIKKDLSSILIQNNLNYNVIVISEEDAKSKEHNLSTNDYIVDFKQAFKKVVNGPQEIGFGNTDPGYLDKKSEVYFNRVPQNYLNSKNDEIYFLAFTAAHELVHQFTEDALFRFGIKDKRMSYKDKGHTVDNSNTNDKFPYKNTGYNLNTSGSKVPLNLGINSLKKGAYLSVNHANLLKLDKVMQSAKSSNNTAEQTLIKYKLILNGGIYGK